MIKGKVEWHGEKAWAQAHTALVERIARATVLLWTELQLVLNTPAKGERRSRGKGKGSRLVYTEVSKPGEPPRKRTGWLQRHVRYEVDRQQPAGRVGVGIAAKYGLFLERGTRMMRPRPWLVTTARRLASRLRALISGGA